MLRLLRLLFVLFVRSFCSRRDLLLENLALRQQLALLKERRPRPRFFTSDRLFWTSLSRLWSKWQRALILVQPETVVRWHRAGFKMYWSWLSRHRTHAGRRCISLAGNCETSSSAWWPATERGEHRAFMASLRCLGSTSRRELFCVGCVERPAILSPQSDGRHSKTTTVKRLRQWISSPCRRLRLACSTASL